MVVRLSHRQSQTAMRRSALLKCGSGTSLADNCLMAVVDAHSGVRMAYRSDLDSKRAVMATFRNCLLDEVRPTLATQYHVGGRRSVRNVVPGLWTL
jgi:hypothetical protein